MKTETSLRMPYGCTYRIELTNGERFLTLAVTGVEPTNSLKLAVFSSDAHYQVFGQDELSQSYDRSNWMSAIISGARYALRKLNIPLHRFTISEFVGKLHSEDMQVIAEATGQTIAAIAHEELPTVELDGWNCHITASTPQTSDLSPAL